jgi:hypothetical protein
MWDARKSFRHFRATIGIDYEGGSTETIPSARRSAEVVKFAVIGDGRVLFESYYMDSAEKPLTFDVNIEGVSLVTLVAERSTPQGWLYGSVCWGDARFER